MADLEGPYDGDYHRGALNITAHRARPCKQVPTDRVQHTQAGRALGAYPDSYETITKQ